MKSKGIFVSQQLLLRVIPYGLAFFLLTTAPLPAHASQVILTYTYDNDSRLTAVQFNDGNVVAYSYDAAGNQTSIASTFIPTSLGDCNRDGAVDLKDAILGLQALGGSPVRPFDLGADVDTDGKIGFAEVINALQAASN